MSAPTTPISSHPDARVTRLANGVRVAAAEMPWRHTVNLSVFIQTGSLHEPKRLNGISHVVEHMAFKGTQTRDCQRINLDAERRGAEVNAHTDKDHTAFHIEGLPGDLYTFVAQLADIALHSTFPEDELARELQVIEQEFAEFEDDPAAVAFQLFDRACHGMHPAGQPVIGSRACLKRIKRDDLVDYVSRQYTAGNVVVEAAGPVDFDAFVTSVEKAFGAMRPGLLHAVAPPSWQGGLKLRRLPGSSQCQIVVGFDAPVLGDERHVPWVLAAALLGEGMSSPLLDEIRERRGLAYHVGCSADIFPHSGQLLIDAATAPDQVEECLTAVAQLIRQHARGTLDNVGLERARNQIVVRTLRALEQPARRLESMAQDIFTFGQPRDPQAWIDKLRAVPAADVQQVFKTMSKARAAVALAGRVPQKARTCALSLFNLS